MLLDTVYCVVKTVSDVFGVFDTLLDAAYSSNSEQCSQPSICFILKEFIYLNCVNLVKMMFRVGLQ